ncbi:MAG: metallophosphoesterase [Magnetococcales bacterium]|nr:metallophosphoesterase [Magnetococcales bacterium]
MNRKRVSLFLLWAVTALFSTSSYGQVTLPPSLLSQSTLVFYALGDQGSGSTAQRQVAATMEEEAQRAGDLDFILLLGDNFYPNGVLSIDDPQWKSKFETIYTGPTLSTLPFIAVLGNHDHRGNQDAQVLYSQRALGSKRWKMFDRVFAVNLGQVDGKPLVRLVGLDTTDKKSFNRQGQFLRTVFSNNQKNPVWRIAAGHHPLYSIGPHGPTLAMHQQLLPAMVETKIDLYLAGHDHNLQLISHPNAPLQVVSGGGGKSLYSLEREEDELDFALSQYGFVRVAVTPHKLTITFFDLDGNKRYETVQEK